MRRPLAALALAALLLGGCGMATSIDSRALVVGLAVDKGSKPGLLRYTFQVPGPQSLGSGSSGRSGSSFYYPSAEAASFAQAIASVEDRTSRDIYLGQVQIILVALDIPAAERDRFVQEEARIGEVDHTEWVAFAKPSASKLLPPPPTQEELPSLFYSTHFQCRTCQTSYMGLHAWQAEKQILGPGHTAVLPVVRMTVGQYDASTVAAFQPGRRPVVFDKDETGYLMLALGMMHKGVVRVETALGPAVVRSMRVAVSRRAQVDPSGRLRFALDVRVGGTIARAPTKAARVTPAVERMMAQAVAQAVRSELAKVVRKAQASKVDPFHFAEALNIRDPDRLQALGSWDDAFARASVALRVRVKLPHQGITV